jgi:hypothetical protein
MKETNYLISLQHLPLFICVIQTYFRAKTELKVIGHMSDPNSTSPDILSDGPVKDILRPAYTTNTIILCSSTFVSRARTA